MATAHTHSHARANYFAPLSDVSSGLLRIQRTHPAIKPPQSTSARGEGGPAVCKRRWLDPLVAPPRLARDALHILRARAPVSRHCRSRPLRLRLRHGLRRMIVAVIPRTFRPPSEASPFVRWGRNLGCSLCLAQGQSPRGRRGRPSPHSTRGCSMYTPQQAWPSIVSVLHSSSPWSGYYNAG
jgi:hypothetical protein